MLPRQRAKVSRLAADAEKFRQKAPVRRQIEVEASVARCLPPPRWSNPSGLRLGFSNRSRGLSNLSIVVVQLLHSPMTAEPYREKTRPLRPRRSCFAPAETRDAAGLGAGAGCCPPRSEWLSRRQFISIPASRHSKIWGPVVEKTGRNPAQSVWGSLAGGCMGFCRLYRMTECRFCPCRLPAGSSLFRGIVAAIGRIAAVGWSVRPLKPAIAQVCYIRRLAYLRRPDTTP
jgi:hypothetical protein